MSPDCCRVSHPKCFLKAMSACDRPGIYIKLKKQQIDLKELLVPFGSDGIIVPASEKLLNLHGSVKKDQLLESVFPALQENNRNFLPPSLLNQKKFIFFEMGNFADPGELGKLVVKALSHVTETCIVGLEMDSQESDDHQWKKWQKFLKAAGHHPKISLCLTLGSKSLSTKSEKLLRWLCENVVMLVVPRSAFELHTSDFLLSMKHEEIIERFLMNTKCAIVVEETYKINYITEKMVRDVNRVVDQIESCSSPDWFVKYGHLQTPLEPLHDNLDNWTYEEFEKDPVKYVLYQKAVEAALCDKILDEEKETKKLVLLIAGAGRGPLIRACYNAMKNTNRKMEIIVVEKNPKVIGTLLSLIEELFKGEDATLLEKDVRYVELDEKVDIIMSELLGSFGDNELSPEVLDGAQKHLKSDGIFIPCKSTTHLRPVMASNIYHREMKSFKPYVVDGKIYSKNNEMNYVVYPANLYYIDEPKDLWEFEHPNHDQVIDNSRHKQLQFTTKVNCYLHGFTGYFVAQLYKDIQISIHPPTHTKNLISWYPMFFPVLEPIRLKQGVNFSVDFWRKIETDVKVWYEWCVNSGEVSNKNGEIHPIRLS